MKTAIITGASAGLGREFVLGARDNFKDIESFWVIARREEKLREYIDLLPGKDVKILAMDLCNEANFDIIADILKHTKIENATEKDRNIHAERCSPKNTAL